MPLAHARSPASLSTLRQGIFDATRDPDLAERVFGLAVASKSPPARTVLPWLGDRPVPMAPAWQARPLPAVAHLAHDLCVLLAFVRADQGERAAHILGPADRRIVQQLGGWRALHDIAPHFRRRHLLRRLLPLLTSAKTGQPVRGGRALAPAKRQEAQKLLARVQEAAPWLSPLDVYDLVAQPLSLGALAFLLDRLAAATEGWGAERVKAAWYRLAARCPTAVE